MTKGPEGHEPAGGSDYSDVEMNRSGSLGSQRRSYRRASQWMVERRWAISVVILYACTVVLSAMDRFLTWDEAVFWSQSGGLDGASTGPFPLVASRELGSSFLIRVFRLLENDIADVRFLWASTAFFVLVVGARRLISHIGDSGALLFLWIYGSYWLVIAWTPSFYSNVLAAALALIAATFYLDLVARPTSASFWIAAAFGASVAAVFAMRPLEAMLVVVGFAIHFALFNYQKVRPLMGKAALSVGVAALCFGVPWVIDSVARFGSVSGRVQAGLSQGGQVASGLRWNLSEYLGALSGDRVAGLGGPVPYWPRFVILAAVVGAVIVVIVALIRRGFPAVRGPAGLFALLSMTNLSFFLFWREAVSERYLFISMIFAVALFAWGLTVIAPGALASPTKWFVAAVALFWIATQVIMATAYEESRDSGTERAARIAATMRTLSNDEPCEGFSRYGSPQLQVASGCRMRSYQDWGDLAEFLEENPEDVPRFIYGPESGGQFEELQNDWIVVESGSFRFAFWIPELDGTTG